MSGYGLLILRSLCPSLGEKYSVINSGMCPSDLQNPNGKEMPVAVIGVTPHILYNKEKEIIGGAEFPIIDVYAEKFNFTPSFIRAPSYDKGGLVEMVS